MSDKLIMRIRCDRTFYRDVLEKIANRKRRTIEQQLAESALTFYDEIVRERDKRLCRTCASYYKDGSCALAGRRVAGHIGGRKCWRGKK